MKTFQFLVIFWFCFDEFVLLTHHSRLPYLNAYAATNRQIVDVTAVTFDFVTVSVLYT